MPVFKDENAKKNPWYYVIEIGEGGQRKRTKKRGFKTKKEAQAAMVEAENSLNKGTYVQASKTSAKEFAAQWLSAKEHSVNKTTYDNYDRHIRIHIAPYFKDQEIGKISDLDCLRFITYLRKEKELASRSVKDVFKVLRAILDWGVMRGQLIKNPTRMIDMPKVEQQEVQVWDTEQVRKFDEIASKHREYVAFLLAYAAGLRQGELLGLRWKDIDFEQKTLSVVQTLSHDGKELTAGAKTATGTRLVSLDDKTIAELKKRKRLVAAEKLSAGGVYEDNDLVVATSIGTPLGPRNMLRTFYRLISEAELPELTIHDLRHTHATLLLKQGVHPKIVSERLGHASVKITLDLYSHLLPNMQKETADQFGKMLFGTN
ncbi:tyrosine-type recombinase/integrase [Paenibacillus aurantiacus]|uniref:Tyrosine-type recombinase/integrase n=1 Tax=Paenibacillus aurantiacus TaxID=1936118 RepID=A0ABV5KZX3_9BACL